VEARFALAAGILAAALLAAPAAAGAATIAAAPARPCYGAGEPIALTGSGYTPNGQVTITSDGAPLGTDEVEADGSFLGELTVGLASGEKIKTYGAQDQSNPANSATVQLRISALTLTLRPRRGRPDRRFRIRAKGFTTGENLYAHVVRRRSRRTVKLGRLKGDCHELSTRRRLFPRSVARGTYRVQFDTRRKYSRKTPQRIRRSFTVR
jgi:hypothetical protein